MVMGDARSTERHIILVHGLCHGAWSWYKVATLLRSAGYRVTVPDLAAAGVDGRRLQDLRKFADYAQPLLDLLRVLPPDERVVLVGHSLGGLNIALAMDRFPEKVAAGVFVTALMPDSLHPPGHVYTKVDWPETSSSYWMDTEFGEVGGEEEGARLAYKMFGPKFLAAKVYDLSPAEDVTLAASLVRPGCNFIEELSAWPPLSPSGYGSVEKVYVVCEKDRLTAESAQRRMMESNPVKEVKVIEDADHMPMMSAPEQLWRIISDIADAYIF